MAPLVLSVDSEWVFHFSDDIIPKLFCWLGGLEMRYLKRITVTKLVLTCSLMFCAAGVNAQEKAAGDIGWEGSGEMGFVNTTGNTETVAVNIKLNFVRTGKKWRHRFSGTALRTSEDGIEDNERYTTEIQSDRKFGEKSWLFGAFRWDADKFGSYDPQLNFTLGYGRQLMQSEKHQLKGELGAGYRKLTETVSRVSNTEAIIRFLLDDSWHVFKTTKWSNRLLIESGSSNTFFQFNTGLAVSMTDRFAVKLGFEVRNNTKIPPDDSQHTDTITSANLVYNF